jgi:uncharacterized membrane protein (Fun14 family)
MGIGAIIGGFSGFKAKLLLAAGFVVFCGFAWTGTRQFFRDTGVAPARSGAAMAPANWAQGPSRSEKTAAEFDHAGDAAVRVGLSFMLAMVGASILRAAFKTGLALLVVAGVTVWFLDYQGHVDLWGDYLGAVKGGGGWLSTRVSAFGEICRQHLPSTGAALVGFGFGLKR